MGWHVAKATELFGDGKQRLITVDYRTRLIDRAAIARLSKKSGSFIRLRRVLLLRSDIRLATSYIRCASFRANKISLKPQALISLTRKRQ